jgi:hypothetical protein
MPYVTPLTLMPVAEPYYSDETVTLHCGGLPGTSFGARV